VHAKDRCAASELVAQAVIAVREIQVLQAPHIAEISDTAMTELEKQMNDLRTQAREALSGLEKLAPPGGVPLAIAKAQLDQLDKQSDDLVALSRRNTNVLSVDLALRTKPPLTRACDDGLHVLEVALVGRARRPLAESRASLLRPGDVLVCESP